MHRFDLESPRRQRPFSEAPYYEQVLPDGTLWSQYFHTNSGYLLRFPDVADFQISRDGLSVMCSPAPDVTDAFPNHIYLNLVLPLAQSIQGKLVLHASAVEIAACAVAFAAESGRGKSTLAAGFATSGFRFLTDDALVIEVSGQDFQALPSHPSIRLWCDSEEALIAPGTETALTLESTSKARFLAGRGIAFCDRPRPLRRVYFLGDGSASSIAFERLSPADALVSSVMHSFLLDVEKKPLLASHFDEVTRFANQPIFYRLDYPRRFEGLGQVRQAVAEHATRNIRDT